LRLQLRAAFLAVAWLYLIGLGGWFVANRVLGDRSCRSCSARSWRGSERCGPDQRLARLFLFLYGGLWLPRSAPKAAGPMLTVMTYNVPGFNDCPKCVVATIR